MRISNFIWQVFVAVIVFLVVGYLFNWSLGLGIGIGILIIIFPWKKVLKKK